MEELNKWDPKTLKNFIHELTALSKKYHVWLDSEYRDLYGLKLYDNKGYEIGIFVNSELNGSDHNSYYEGVL